MSPRPAAIDVESLAEGVHDGKRAAMARAITLVESTRPDHQDLAQDLLVRLLPDIGSAQRVGISGVPGAGKSTFIDALGTMLTGSGHRVAVLAVDPSSTRHGGSILGDKTRMTRLAVDPQAFIRPSPTSGTLGGVARATKQAMVVVEAAGYDVVLVETVGVGQSETTVAEMVDTFLLLMVARTGDALQGMKRGVLELADVITVNKADGDNVIEAKRAARELADVLRLMEPTRGDWRAPVLTCSALNDDGVEQVWEQVCAHRAALESTGDLTAKRADQEVSWMWSTVQDRVLHRLRHDPGTRQTVTDLERALHQGDTTATRAAQVLLDKLGWTT
ncbi:MAG: methylmalonyl Co-A mutase-associated GTPase MeaB [Jiangellales bacterium]